MPDDPHIPLVGGRFDRKRVHDPAFDVGEDDLIVIIARDRRRFRYVVDTESKAVYTPTTTKIFGRSWQVTEENLV